MLASLVGGIADAFQGTPDYQSINVTKNGAIDYLQNQLLGDANSARTSGQSALRDYIKQFLAGNSTATANTGQETAAIGGFYNGDVARQLAQLRAQTSTATNNAADVATQQALRYVDLSRLGGDGSGSSYDQRLAMANLTPIRVQAGLSDANQARTDYGYLTGQQLALAGQRTALENQLAQRALAPQQARLAMLGANTGNLNSLSALDNLNHTYGIQQQMSTIDKLNQGGQKTEQSY